MLLPLSRQVHACCRWAAHAFLLVLVTWSVELPAQELAGDDPEAIRQEDPGFFVQVAVDRLTRQYRQGDPLTVKVTCESDAYAYVLYKQADGKVYQIFPNSVQTDNRVRAKQTTQIPAIDDTFTWTVAAPYGREVVKVVASKDPLPPLAAEELFAGRFNEVAPKVVEDAAKALKGADPRTWAEDSVEITTYDAEPENAEPSGRRVGLFVGLSEFKYNDEYGELSKGKWQPNLPASSKDARLTAHVMKELSRLDEVRVMVDGQATKAGLEEAITRWLPTATKPGDTAVIYIETHGGGIDDDDGDEPDGIDEYLMTYDCADISILGLFGKRADAGTITPENRQLLESVRAYLSANKTTLFKLDQASLAKHLNRYIVHKTAVTDDLFGHWLQRLAGRKVVVIMATCHAGGFAVNEKSLQPADAPTKLVDFDFLTGELGRLKDIGQPDSVVITACTAAQVSYSARLSPQAIEELRKQTGTDLPIAAGESMHTLPYGIIESLAASPSRQPIDVTFRDVHDRVMKFVSSTSQPEDREPISGTAYRHEPQFYNFSTRPIYLKP